MELGKRISGRYLATRRRKGLIAPSGLLTRYMRSRYGRRFLALRPLALAHLKQAVVRGEGKGAVHQHLHLHFPWQADIERRVTGIARLAVIPAKAGIQEVWRLQRMDSRQKHSGMTSQKIAKASVPTRFLTSSSPLGGDGGGGGGVLRKLYGDLPRLSIFTHPLPVAGFSATGAQPFHQGPATDAIRERGDDMRLIGRGQSVGTDIRVLSPRVVTNAAAVKNVARQEVQGNASRSIQAGTGHEAVRLAVKRETSNSASAEAPSQSVSATSVAPQITTTGPVTAAAAVQAVQPEIDVNRLTDEIYRMLERRLVTERERRGR